MSKPPVKDGSWYYVVEPENGAFAPQRQHIVAGDGRVLTKRTHGYAARVEAVDASGEDLPVAVLLRGASVAGRVLEQEQDALNRTLRVVFGPAGTQAAVRVGDDGVQELVLDGPHARELPSHHILHECISPLLEAGAQERTLLQAPSSLPEAPTPRALFFEALMNTDTPHNETELSQGVLHMISPLKDLETEVVLVDVKMSIVGEDRPVLGLERLEEALKGGPVGLVCITLLEGYFEGVCSLITELRELGCRARIAVGGVMPTLTPAHVAAHLPEVSFVCRGAGEPTVRRLVEILGDTCVDDPLTPDQRLALLALDGVFSIERTGEGKRLLAANPRQMVEVQDLDLVPLNVEHIEPRHLVNGVEICTSRGCIHKCTFCSIIGRQSYQARSADGLIELLERYEEHYQNIFGDEIPHNAFCLHLSDDDFACDRDRARSFFEKILATPFRLTSVQVAITDLCRKEGSKLVPQIDEALLDAMRPECFAHSTEEISDEDFIWDHRNRRWSSYLQMGVESFSDVELARLGKGYKRAHIRKVAEELASRGIHFDSYFILSNADTTGEDLIDVLEEICRLKLRYPKYFHIKFPIVKRLVSVFPSASYRRIIRQGRAEDICQLRMLAQTENHPEYDYPFVNYDKPRNPWVKLAAESDFFTDDNRYTASLDRLSDLWLSRVEELSKGEERREGERLIRRLDQLSRHLVFDLMLHARQQANPPEDWPGEPPTTEFSLRSAREILGPPNRWKDTFQLYSMESIPRMVVIPTWECELRCGYCFIPKQGGRVMDATTMERSIDLLLSSELPELVLQFFGGEAMLEYELLQHALRYGTERAVHRDKRLSFLVSSNGWALDEEKIAWFSQYPVKLELSVDGDEETQLRYRSAARWIGGNSYEHSIIDRVDAINQCGLPYDVIMVVHPKVVDRMYTNFFHIADKGFRRIQINFALGFRWTEEQKKLFADGLMEIGRELRTRWERGQHIEFVNLDGKAMPMRLNGELTIDWDGTVYGGNGFLHETEHKDRFLMGDLDDLRGFDSYRIELSNNEYLLEWSYPPEVTENNLQIGAIFTSFIRWMQQEEVNPIRRSVEPQFQVG